MLRVWQPIREAPPLRGLRPLSKQVRPWWAAGLKRLEATVYACGPGRYLHVTGYRRRDDWLRAGTDALDGYERVDRWYMLLRREKDGTRRCPGEPT